MTATAFVALGILSYFNLPISLLPEIEVPEIKIFINYEKYNAEELERSIVKIIQDEVRMVSGVNSVESYTNSGFSAITITLGYKTNPDFVVIEINEKVDKIMSSLPPDLIRPIIIKSKVTDIPVLYLSIWPNENYYSKGFTFYDFSKYVEKILKRRFEQQKEISIADISGLEKKEIVIAVDETKMNSLNISYQEIEREFNDHKIATQGLTFKNGVYTYSITLDSPLKSIEDLRELSFNKSGNIYKLSSFANITLIPHSESGSYFHNGSRSINMAIYKQPEARIEEMYNAVVAVIKEEKLKNPELEFCQQRNQSQLLDFSFNNLKYTLFISIILSAAVIFVFTRRAKYSLIIIISIPVTLIISLASYTLLGISLNIISFSGLILSVGLVIDNVIIVVDNIDQHILRTDGVDKAIVVATNEMIRPLLSSTLTTTAVFIPLITIGGLSGALFYDQAVTISATLLISFIISITLIPTLVYIIYGTDISNRKYHKHELLYEKAVEYLLKRKVFFMIVFLLTIPVTVLLFFQLDKNKFPNMPQHDFIAEIDMNEPISTSENKRRIKGIMDNLSKEQNITVSAQIGRSDFKFNNSNSSSSKSELYITANNNIEIDSLKNMVSTTVSNQYPNAHIVIKETENAFNKIFQNENDLLMIKLRSHDIQSIFESGTYNFINESLGIPAKEQIGKYLLIKPDYEKMAHYGIKKQEFINTLKIAIVGIELDKFSGRDGFHNIILTNSNSGISALNGLQIKNISGIDYPIRDFIKTEYHQGIIEQFSDDKGKFVPISISNYEKFKENKTNIEELAINEKIDIDYSGFFRNQKELFTEYLTIIIISVALLFFILSAQFESVLLPLIILTEVVFDVAGALMLLYIFDADINIMSGLGIIIMTGIVINDSIIKISTIDQEYRSGKGLVEAIKVGGLKRLNPILMTSLTTILSMLPFLFFSGIGAELQTPLSLAIIGGLTLGTIVSLFFIPIAYYYLRMFSPLQHI